MKHYFVLAFAFIMITACHSELPSPLAARPTPVLTPVYATAALTPQNIQRAVDLNFITGELSVPVIALAFTADGQELLAVYGKEALLKRWRLEDNALLSTMNLDSNEIAVAAFDAGADLLVVGTGKTDPAVQADAKAHFNEVGLWDTRSGKLVSKINAGSEYSLSTTDVLLSLDGHWLAIAYSSGLDVWDTTTGKAALLSTILSRPKDNHSGTSITTVAFDPTGTWIAYADDGGYMTLQEWKTDSSRRMRILQSHSEATPLDLAFDVSRQRLAVVTTESLMVWDLQSWLGDVLLNEPMPFTTSADLVFSPDGTLLALGTANGWQIWSVNDKKILAEGDHPTYAVKFNPDGRLFAWGDTLGTIHVWGVPNQ